MTHTPKTSGTVQEIVFEVLRSRGMTMVFGNPGSTELAAYRGARLALLPGLLRPHGNHAFCSHLGSTTERTSS